jgi:hypothetical protein
MSSMSWNPNETALLTLDYSQNGMPFVRVGSKSTLNLNGLDYSNNGGSWWGIDK